MNWAYVQKHFWNILKLACFIAFIVQIGASIKSQIAPKKTAAETVITDLADVDFPVAFKVCMKPSFNNDELKKVGYDYSYRYFSGQSKYEREFGGTGTYGWTGHTEGGGVFSNARDVQNKIFMDYHSAIVGTMMSTNKVLMKNISTNSYKLEKPNYPNNCLTLDIGNNLTPGERVKFLSIKFYANKFATDIDIIIEDRLILIDRTNMLSTRNQPINYDNLRKNLTKTFLVTLKQNVFQDKETTFCVNYPTDKFKSFNDCDNQYLEELLQKGDLYPAWATPQDLNKATNSSKSSGLGGEVISYFMGTNDGPCVDPCTQTSIQAVYKGSNMLTFNDVTLPAVTLHFNPVVEVTTHALPKFNPLDVLQVG